MYSKCTLYAQYESTYISIYNIHISLEPGDYNMNSAKIKDIKESYFSFYTYKEIAFLHEIETFPK
jgi:hypothetical protein